MERFGISDWERGVPQMEAERLGEGDIVRQGHCQLRDHRLSRGRGPLPGNF